MIDPLSLVEPKGLIVFGFKCSEENVDVIVAEAGNGRLVRIDERVRRQTNGKAKSLGSCA